ncbi:dUTP diphosphatase [Thiomicrorhabdus arctica]|uniref:dUTP diphosphatase n=1 Tax=Thiomicrorhabdus arctica TaxID=131540 RepID=UPI000371F100|nr:dUTP diphosphatase [Thiomicrorhabdus arctica]
MQNQSSIHAIHEMLHMQSALNKMTNGAEWRSGLTQLGKVIDWKRCIYMEAAELIDSYPWKHWKNITATTDMENVRIELVDIWHFLLSLTLETLEISKAAILLDEAFISNSEQVSIVHCDMPIIKQVLVHETLMRIALESGEVSEGYLTRLAKSFVNACQVAELSFEQMYQIYMAKNVLNKFRQDHGYKEGTYIKEWNGKEDNIVMFEIIATMTDFSGDQLYLSLKENYRLINGS